ncbi:MAG TPA: DNA-3-methyladenine glycosylase I [Salinisphaeraceae bacterium]|nr:DNA-3-methyladenine glycosylase I [Salinisphaeraceae bacterium]
MTTHQPMLDYHDQEWGVPLHDDNGLFEFLCLEGAQAGLSWRTVLDKRARYWELFHGFDIARVAAMTDAELERTLADSGIIRNRRKVFSMRNNARLALEIVAEHGSLAQYLWAFVEHRTQINHWQRAADVPANTAQSDAMSRALYKRGLRFVGSTICYSLMQATGMVNDHLSGCFRHAQCAALAARS